MIFRIFGSYTAILKARKLKLVTGDHLKGANVLGYLDIRISASSSAVPCVVANLEMIINDLFHKRLEQYLRPQRAQRAKYMLWSRSNHKTSASGARLA